MLPSLSGLDSFRSLWDSKIEISLKSAINLEALGCYFLQLIKFSVHEARLCVGRHCFQTNYERDIIVWIGLFVFTSFQLVVIDSLIIPRHNVTIIELNKKKLSIIFIYFYSDWRFFASKGFNIQGKVSSTPTKINAFSTCSCLWVFCQ